MERQQPHLSELTRLIPYDTGRRFIAIRFLEEMREVDFEGVVASMNIHPTEGENIPKFYVLSYSNDPSDVDCLKRKVGWAVAGTCASRYQEKQLGYVEVFGVADFMSHKTGLGFVCEQVTVLLEKGPQECLSTYMPGTILNSGLN